MKRSAGFFALFALFALFDIALLCASCASPDVWHAARTRGVHQNEHIGIGAPRPAEEGANEPPLFAGEPVASVPSCPSGGHIALWRASGRAHGEPTRVYLFGSIHVGKPEFYPLPPGVESAFASSRRLAVEFDSRSESVQREMEEAFAKGHFEAGRSLRDVLDPQIYELLLESMRSMGLPEEELISFEPWVLAPALTVARMQTLGYLPDFGVDRYLLERAGDREVVELESASQQLALLQSLDGEQFLTYTLLSLETLEADAKRLIDAWFCGDVAALEQILLDPHESKLADTRELVEAIFSRRNIRMADRIEELLRDPGDSFVVVGAGHLIGERGVVALLRKRGWQVTRE